MTSPPIIIAGHTEASLVAAVLVQLALIIAAARLAGWLFHRFGQPEVIGEIAAGFVLGPSVFGWLAPELSAAVFPRDWPELASALAALAEVGLVLMIFLVGMEFEFDHLRRLGRAATSVSAAGIMLPCALGAALAWWMHPHVAASVNRTAFVLFMAVALSITAIPVLARIMYELGLTRTEIGTLTITAAAVDDTSGWIMLAAASAIVRGSFDPTATAGMLGQTALYVAIVAFAVRPLVKRHGHRLLGNNGQLGLRGLSLVLVMVLLSAVATTLIGVFSVFGPFVLGACLWDQHALREAINRRLRDIVAAMFLPVFFTHVGLRTDIGALSSAVAWMFCGLVFVAAVAGKVIGCGLAARASGGLSWRQCGAVAVMMNTRGLMELVVVTIGRDLGAVPDSVGCMLVLMALGTTLATAPLVRRLIPSLIERQGQSLASPRAVT